MAKDGRKKKEICIVTDKYDLFLSEVSSLLTTEFATRTSTTMTAMTENIKSTTTMMREKSLALMK